MAVKVIERIYNEIYTPGETDWLLGNVGDWQKVKVKVEVAIEFFAESSSPITIDYINNSFEIADGTNWGELGFDPGMQVTLNYKLEEDTTGDGNFNQVTTIQQVFNALNVFGSVMEVDAPINGQGFENIPTNFGIKRITDVHFFVDNDPEGCIMKYAHITNENSQTENLSSFIDGSKAEFIFPNLKDVIQGSWVDMEAIGFQSGMAIRNTRVRKLGEETGQLFTTYEIPSTGSLLLAILDNVGNPEFRNLRSAKANLITPQTGYQSATSDERVPTGGTGVPVNGANQNQAFLFDSPSDYTQQIFFNLNVRITDVNKLNVDSKLRLVIYKYTNGASMDYVEKTTLREWSNIQPLLNSPLNFNGIKSFTINESDSLVLGVEFFQNPPYNNETRAIDYQWIDGVMQLSQPDGTIGGGPKRTYEFEVEYLIHSMFESILNIENTQAPSYLIGDGSVTDNFSFEFFPEWNNPNVFVKNNIKRTARLGNTGWFNENFNQLDNDFNIDSVVFLDSDGNTVSTLDYSQLTKVRIQISGVPNLNANTECGFGFAWIPLDEEDYHDKETPFHQNIFIQSGSISDGFKLDTFYPGPYSGFGIGGNIRTENVQFTRSGDVIIMEANFIPGSGFFSIFDAKDAADRNFILWVSVADGEQVRNFSDRVSLLAHFGLMEKNIPAAGPYPYLDNKFLEHPEAEGEDGVLIMQGIVQDEILCRVPFRIETGGQTVFERMTFGIEAYNASQSRSVDLQRYEVDLTSYIIDNDNVHQIMYNQERGFKLNAGNNKNWARINRTPSGDTSVFNSYLAYFAFKIRWEDWILNPEATGDFYDASQDNNGLHHDWINYLNTNGWVINFYVESVAKESGELKLYKNQFQFNFVDYDSNANINTAHRYLRDSDDTNITVGTDPETGRPLGVILSNEPTRIEIDFTITDAGVWSLADTYGVMTIEIDKGPGQFEQRQLSSVWNSESDNPLKPVDGETKLKLEVEGTNKTLTMSAIVDPDLLDDGARYRITGRVGCRGDETIVFDPGLYEFRYEQTYE